MTRNRTLARAGLAGLILVAAGPPGCASSSSAPYAPQTEGDRDPAEAQRLTLEAAGLVERDPARAEDLLRRALTHDLFSGPAHNNLGVLYLKQGKLYESASELEWGRKLLPGLPEPRLNLALVLERAGRTQEALDTYRTALEVYPGHIQTMQAIARLQVRAGKTDDSTHEYLCEIALRGDSERWRTWARAQLAVNP